MKTRRGSAARVGVEQSRAANAQQAIHFWFIKFTRKCGANFRRFGAEANRKMSDEPCFKASFVAETRVTLQVEAFSLWRLTFTKPFPKKRRTSRAASRWSRR